MAKEKMQKRVEEEKARDMAEAGCRDAKCPFHGKLSLRGRVFRGAVIKKFPKRICIEFERTVYIKKYERYAKKRTKIHARLPDCLAGEIKIGDYIEVHECRPLSKIINFVAVRKIK